MSRIRRGIDLSEHQVWSIPWSWCWTGFRAQKGEKGHSRQQPLQSVSFHLDGIWPGSSFEAQYSMTLNLKYESVSQGIFYNLFTTREIIFWFNSGYTHSFTHDLTYVCSLSTGWVYCIKEIYRFAYSVHCIMGNEWWRKQTSMLGYRWSNTKEWKPESA